MGSNSDMILCKKYVESALKYLAPKVRYYDGSEESNEWIEAIVNFMRSLYKKYNSIFPNEYIEEIKVLNQEYIKRKEQRDFVVSPGSCQVGGKYISNDGLFEVKEIWSSGAVIKDEGGNVVELSDIKWQKKKLEHHILTTGSSRERQNIKKAILSLDLKKLKFGQKLTGRVSHCYACKTTVDDLCDTCFICGWFSCPSCEACGCQYESA